MVVAGLEYPFAAPAIWPERGCELVSPHWTLYRLLYVHINIFYLLLAALARAQGGGVVKFVVVVGLILLFL